MKKSIFILAIILIGLNSYSQKKDSVNTAVVDTVTLRDMAIHRYLLGYDLTDYQIPLYKDSIPITDFYNKDITGYWWKSVGQFYWTPFEPLPAGVKYLHRKPTFEGILEYLINKYKYK